MPTKLFQRNIEDFTCGHCGQNIKGNGYTNHCPKCLWSKHVDKNPGDRADECNGMMRPKNIFVKNGKYIITHICEKCGHEKKNKSSRDDDMEEIIKLSSKL